MKQATIHDICKMTGLSLGTVSKYLNGGKVKEFNRKKLDDAVKKLHYQVDEYARGLVTNKTKTVGVLVSKLDNLFYSRIISDIEKRLYKKGYATIIKESSYDHEKEIKSISWFISRRVDALIIFPIAYKKEDYEILENVDVPVIFLDNYVEGLDRDFVLTDNEHICYEVTDYVLGKGHKNIAIIISENNAYTARMRLSGFRKACEKHGLSSDSAKAYAINEDIDSAYNVAKEIVKTGRFSAVFAANYPSTLGVVYLLNEQNISVPETISVIGFDDIMITNLYKPKLTIVNQPMKEIAKKTVDRLFELIASPELKKEVYILENELIIGQTIATL